jgi:hypothetical protein
LRGCIRTWCAADDRIEPRGVFHGIVEVVEMDRVARFHDGSTEELIVTSAIGSEMEAHRSSTSTLTKDSDLLGVACCM